MTRNCAYCGETFDPCAEEGMTRFCKDDCHECFLRANYEPPEPDGEAFRGGEAAAFEAETQARIQRELK